MRPTHPAAQGEERLGTRGLEGSGDCGLRDFSLGLSSGAHLWSRVAWLRRANSQWRLNLTFSVLCFPSHTLHVCNSPHLLHPQLGKAGIPLGGAPVHLRTQFCSQPGPTGWFLHGGSVRLAALTGGSPGRCTVPCERGPGLKCWL